MNILLSIFFLVTIICLTIIQVKPKTCIILTIMIIACLFLYFYVNTIIVKKIDHIGQEIEDKKVIGYEDRIILIEEEGGIKIPWYVDVTEIYNENYYIVVGGGSISVYYPKEGCKTYSSQ